MCFAPAYRSRELLHLFHWPRLRSLVLKFHFRTANDVADVIVFLKQFAFSTLTDVIVELQMPHTSISETINRIVSDKAAPGKFKELEQTLFRFPQPGMVCLVNKLHEGRNSFRTRELGKSFPMLLQRGALTLTSKIGVYQSYHIFVARNRLIT